MSLAMVRWPMKATSAGRSIAARALVAVVPVMSVAPSEGVS